MRNGGREVDQVGKWAAQRGLSDAGKTEEQRSLVPKIWGIQPASSSATTKTTKEPSRGPPNPSPSKSQSREVQERGSQAREKVWKESESRVARSHAIGPEIGRASCKERVCLAV